MINRGPVPYAYWTGLYTWWLPHTKDYPKCIQLQVRKACGASVFGWGSHDCLLYQANKEWQSIQSSPNSPTFVISALSQPQKVGAAKIHGYSRTVTRLRRDGKRTQFQSDSSSMIVDRVKSHLPQHYRPGDYERHNTDTHIMRGIWTVWYLMREMGSCR